MWVGMCLYVLVCVCVCLNVYMCVCVCVCVCTHLCVCLNCRYKASLHLYSCVCVDVCISVCAQSQQEKSSSRPNYIIINKSIWTFKAADDGLVL